MVRWCGASLNGLPSLPSLTTRSQNLVKGMKLSVGLLFAGKLTLVDICLAHRRRNLARCLALHCLDSFVLRPVVRFDLKLDLMFDPIA